MKYPGDVSNLLKILKIVYTLLTDVASNSDRLRHSLTVASFEILYELLLTLALTRLKITEVEQK